MKLDPGERCRRYLTHCSAAVAGLGAALPSYGQTEGGSDPLLAILLTWGPVLLIVGLWIYFMRRYFSGVSKSYYQDNQERMANIDRHLERIADSLDRLVDEVKKTR